MHGKREKFVDRSCGNRLCVRPDHLIVRTSESRFWDKVEKTESCYWWRGGRSTAGYGSFLFNGKYEQAHRVAWILTHGPIPTGLYVRHDCDQPSCVRPEHLLLGTQYENVQDCIRRGRKNQGREGGAS